jgi:hypothetical protein
MSDIGQPGYRDGQARQLGAAGADFAIAEEVSVIMGTDADQTDYCERSQKNGV